MGVIVQFNYAQWLSRYPEFTATATSDQAALCFSEATLYQRNDGCGPVEDAGQALVLLNMLTAHVAQLYFGSSLQPSGSIVGRVSGATEGSVSVQTENAYPPGTPQWYQQTKYGASWWAGTVAYRTMRYRSGPRRIFNPPFFGPYR